MSDDEQAEPLRIVVVGDVDQGKSTLIGRLLNDAGALPADKIADLTEIGRKRGMPPEWSFVIDALQAERDQGVTIDTSEVVFHTARRRFAIIDAPGHREFLRNMITGAARADLAVAVIGVSEGALEQSRRHLYLLALLGIRRLVVVVNKMDLADYSAARFERVAAEVRAYLQQLDIGATAIIPIVARHGEMIASRSPKLDWYHGPTLLEAFDRFEPDAVSSDVLPLRFSVQDVYKFDERRILAGRVESGVLRVGDTLSFAPGGAIAKIASIEDWNQPLRRLAASAGDSIGITLEGRALVERGNIAAPASAPIRLAKRLRVRLFWLASEPLIVRRSFGLRLIGGEHRVTVRTIEGVVDLETLATRAADRVLTNEIAEIVLEAAEPLPVDRHAALPRTGRGVLVEGADALGGVIVLDLTEAPTSRVAVQADRGVTREERERRNRHRGGVLWLTGLSGSGKTTLALALERALFEGGMHAFALDGDSLRQDLSRDLGFDQPDRARNLRRVAEAAKLLAEAGCIAIVALISPARADRVQARAIVGDGFAEIFVRADPELCEARNGAIDAAMGTAYEPPLTPDLEIDTAKLDIAEAIDRLIGFVEARFHDPRIDQNLVEPEWSV